MTGSGRSPEDCTGADAAEALTQVRRQYDNVAAEPPFPAWMWPAVGVAVLVLLAGIVTLRPVVMIICGIVCALALAGIIVAVLRRRSLQPHNSLVGRRGAAAIVTFVLGSLLLGWAAFGVAFLAGGHGIWLHLTPVAGASASWIVFGPLFTRVMTTIARDQARKI